ncbi:unnamed protein product [Mucor hiemalis]
MRAFTTFFLAATLALTANAGIIGKRETSAPVNECVRLVNNVKTKLDILDPAFAAYREDDSDVPVDSTKPSISKLEQDHKKLLDDTLKLIDELNAAKEKCCAATINPTTADDLKAISDALGDYSIGAVKVFTTLKSKVNAFNTKAEFYPIVQDILGELFSPTEDFHECLVDISPAAYTKAQESVNNVDRALTEVAKAFKVFSNREFFKHKDHISFLPGYSGTAGTPETPEMPGKTGMPGKPGTPPSPGMPGYFGTP